jgi:hypothetical protein
VTRADEHDGPDDLVAGLEADLVALAAAEADLERDAEIAERTRIERTAIPLVDRLRAARGRIEVSTLGGGRHAGRVVDTGEGWLLLADVPSGGRSTTGVNLVVLESIVAVRGLGRAVAVPGQVRPRSLTSVLRDWCRERAEVSVRTIEGGVVPGLASATFADHLELSTGDGGSLVVPLRAIAVVSR